MSQVSMISIVDDDESVRESTKALVRSLGYTAHTFASAEEFLSSPHLGETDCLITDVSMAGLSGVELQTRLIAEARHMPVIIVTASRNESTRNRVLNAGAIGFLKKPFSAEALIAYIDMALGKSTSDVRDKKSA